jgi:hypothetical protein
MRLARKVRIAKCKASILHDANQSRHLVTVPQIHPDKLQAVAPAQAAYGQALFEVIHSSYEKFKERERL